MCPVSADNDIEYLRIVVTESDSDCSACVLDCLDGIAPPVVDPVASSSMEKASQIRTQQFGGGDETPAAKGVHRHLGQTSSGRINPGDPALFDQHGEARVKEAEARKDIRRRAPKINSLATRPKPRGNIHNINFPAGLVEQDSEGVAGNASTDDQGAHNSPIKNAKDFALSIRPNAY